MCNIYIYIYVCLGTHLFAGSLTVPGHAAATLGCQHTNIIQYKTIEIVRTVYNNMYTYNNNNKMIRIPCTNTVSGPVESLYARA